MDTSTTYESQLSDIQVLVVEDDERIGSLLGDILRATGASVKFATSGRQALDLLQQNRPNVIISDLMMPDGNGFELLQSVQGDPDLNSIPFIFLTARNEPAEVRRGMNLGADDFLTKPVSRKDLVDTVLARIHRTKVCQTGRMAQEKDFRHSLACSLPHELLTPLHLIQGSADLLALDSNLSAENRTVTDILLVGCKRLSETVHRFWRYGELEMQLKGLADQPRKADRLRRAPTNCIQAVAEQIASRLNRSSDLVVLLEADSVPIPEEHLTLLVVELIENAFKFSVTGTRVLVALQSRDNGLDLSITDHGIGMTQQQVAEVGPLRQFHRRVREQQGPGLGLAIVSVICRLHDIQVEFDCDREVGLEVRLNIPHHGATSPAPA